MKKQAKKAKAEANTASALVVEKKPAKAARKAGDMTPAREKLLATAKFKKAHEAALAARAERGKSTICPAGKHDMKLPQHCHTGFLFRVGGLLCRTCWTAKYSRKEGK
jgi:hypothetical protein